MQTDSEHEWWASRASLVVTDDAYVAAVRAATGRLVAERLLLPADAEALIASAAAGRLAH